MDIRDNILTLVFCFCVLDTAARSTRKTDQLQRILNQLRDIEHLAKEERSKGLKIGAFNIQIFGKSKMQKSDVVDVLLQIIPRYDILLIQEIRDSSGKAIVDLFNRLNKQEADLYSMALSDRLGRTNSKEQYAYFFRQDKVTLEDDYQFPDVDDVYERPPYCVKFSTEIAAGLEEFFLVGVHTDPDKAETEVAALVEVYEAASKHFEIQDAILMGDFNADCGYVTKSEWNSVSLRNDHRFKWLIADGIDTTVSSTDCAYDRILSVGDAIDYAIIPQSAQVYRFDVTLDLDPALTKDVSDHYPVEVDFFRKGHRVSPYTTKERVSIESTLAPCIEEVNTRIDDVIEKGYHVATKSANDDGAEVIISLTTATAAEPFSVLEDFANHFPDLLSTEMKAATENSLQEFIRNNAQFAGNEAEVNVLYLDHCSMQIDVTYNV